MDGKQGKQPIGLAVVNQQDVHALLPRLLLQAEKSPDSLERMLAVTRLYFTFLAQLMKPGSKFGDIPTVVLGEHYLSHRNINGELHRGDNTRSYLQEICAYDPVEAPIPTGYETDTAGHVDVGMMNVNLVPSASVKSARVEGSTKVYVEVSFGGDKVGQGALGGGRKNSVHYKRHDEEYVFTVPSLLLTNISKHSASRCRLDFEGNCSITCQVWNYAIMDSWIESYRRLPMSHGLLTLIARHWLTDSLQATGLETSLRFKPFRDEYVKGEIKTLLGDGAITLARLEGHWDEEVSVKSTAGDASGVVFSANDDPPGVSVPPTINLSEPGPRVMRRLWAAILETLMYASVSDKEKKGGDAHSLAAALKGSLLKKSLMYSIPDNPQGKSALQDGGDPSDPTSQLAAALDKRPLPPVSKIQRALGRFLTYQLQYRLQGINWDALNAEDEVLRSILAAAKV